MLERVMVPLDGSPLAEQALPFASAVAKAYQRKAHLEAQVYICRPSRGVQLVSPEATPTED